MAHGVDADLVVHIVGDGHCHQINRGIAEQFFPRSIRMYTRFFRRLVALGLDIIHAAQLDAFVLQGEQLFHMPATHAAVADDGRILLCHIKNSFLNLTSDTGGRPSAPSAAPIIQHLHEKRKVF